MSRQGGTEGGAGDGGADGLRTLPPAEPRGRAITVELDGAPVRAYLGEPLGVALFASEVRLLARSPKYHRPRGLFCAAGQCGSCLMRVDGRPNVRACVEPVHEGMTCERQNAFPDVELDLLRAADWMFPGGMDHHRLMTGSRLGNELFVKLVRQMGGSGTLPDQPAEELPEATDELVDLCIVGAGPAGLAAAEAALRARSGLRLLMVDEQDLPGGSWLAEPGGVERGKAAARAITAAGGRLWLRSSALAIFPGSAGAPHPAPDAADGLLAVARPEGLARIRARRFIHATGAYDQNLPLPNSDQPGALAARAVGRLAFRFGVRPGRRVVIVRAAERAPAYLSRLAEGLRQLRVTVEVVEAGEQPRLDLDRDVLAMGAQPAPASELARQHGARVRFDLEGGGFVVITDGSGMCVPGVFVAGDITGYLGPEAAAVAGNRVGAHVASTL